MKHTLILTLGWVPHGWCPSSRRDLYLTTATLTRQTPVSPVGLELTISASERPQTLPLDLAATGIGLPDFAVMNYRNVI
jgi:hypothetical protein